MSNRIPANKVSKGIRLHWHHWVNIQWELNSYIKGKKSRLFQSLGYIDPPPLNHKESVI